MARATEAIYSKFLQLNRRPAVFDREIRKHVDRWRLEESLPITDIISHFQRNGNFILEDQKVILPLHKPDSPSLTGEYLLYYPDYVVPSIVYYDFAKTDFATIPLEQFGTTYPAWRLRYWHSDYPSSSTPDYHHTGDDLAVNVESQSHIESTSSLADDGAELIEELRSMIARREVSERDEARNRCTQLPPEQFLADRGGIRELVPAGIDVDEYGQQVVRLRIPAERTDGSVDIPSAYGIYPGSEAIVDSVTDESGFPAEAEVLDVEGRQLELSFYWDRYPENPDLSVFELESDARFLLGELLNAVPFDRQRDAIEMVGDDDRKRGWLTGSTDVGFDSDLELSPSKSRLNNSQYRAAHNALRATDVFCIHGPPGTGKTRTLVEIVRAACNENERVLAVAHSNQAVDNLLVGDSSGEHVDRSSIHGLVAEGEITVARVGGNSSNDLVEENYVGNDLYQSDVVCGTMSGVHRFGENIFDLAVIDEATQASIATSLIPATRAKRIVLAGDHKQLPPYYSGEHSDSEEMKPSLFEHLVHRYGSDILATLETQYRMHRDIAAFPNGAFYGGELSHGEDNREWSIAPLDPLEAIHVEGEEKQTPSNSHYNDREAEIVAQQVKQLMDVGVAPMNIGVISPYSGQIGKIRVALDDLDGLDTSSVKIATVDSFQGSEREAIVVSFVRSNPQGFSGFLTFPNEGPRRLNVSLTRARKRCVLVGNFDTLRTRAPTKEPDESSARVYQQLYDHLNSRNLLTRHSE